MMINAAVIGGSGQIGGWLIHWLEHRGHYALGTYATNPILGMMSFDAADQAEVSGWLRAIRPSVVFYPAGFTWVDGCERDPDKAMDANCHQPLFVAKTAHQLGSRFVYFSTDYVFDGSNGPNTESDEPRPLSVYGQSKLKAEQELINELGDDVLIIRTTWVYGPERQGKNFAYQLTKTLSQGQPVVCPNDQISNPTYGSDVALASVVLTERGESGVYHVAGPELMPRDQFARELAAGLGFNPNLIETKSTAELGQVAPRPLQGGLINARLNEYYPDLMRSPGQALPEFRQSGDPWKTIIQL